MHLSSNAKVLCANLICFVVLLSYTIIGGYIFLYFEYESSVKAREEHNERKHQCIVEKLKEQDSGPPTNDHITAGIIAQKCLIDMEFDSRREWNLRNALLFGFGILTTLGYGKIEPMTMNARVFTVVWGFLGVPFTVILLTNLGLYMKSAEEYFRIKWWKNSRRKRFGRRLMGNRTDDEDEEEEEYEEEYRRGQMSPLLLASVVVLYLTIGAVFLPMLDGKFEFINGLYYAYLCFTAIEYGALIPQNTSYIPIVIVFMCIGLAMSTIALDLGSKYVKKLYYYGKSVTNMANVRVWFGGKNLKVKELINALGQTIGVSADSFDKLNVDQMVHDAILVKEGRLSCVPQDYMFMEGIWPPELVPLFLRDGRFPEYVDADEKKYSGSIYSNSNAVELDPSVALATFHDGRLHRSLGGTMAAKPSPKKGDKNNNKV